MPPADKHGLTLWRRHWPEYAIEAALLGGFMVSACLFSVVLFYPEWPAARSVPDPFARRVLMGLAMGSTAVALNYSVWGKRSGAHYNPAVTLTFTRLGKVAPWDAAAYVAAQFVGAVLGVMSVRFLAQSMLANEQVHFAVTRPGLGGVAIAFVGEGVISFLLMTVVLGATNHPRLARYTGLFAGLLVATFIIFEAPLSGMSMNPARTVGSAFWAGDWTALWLYFTAPPLGMLLAAELYLRRRGPPGVFCAKLHHQNDQRCIFCEYWRKGEARVTPPPPSPPLLEPFPAPQHYTPRQPTIISRPTEGEIRMKRRNWVVGLAVLGGIGWYAFRPELLFVRKQVDEGLPVVSAQTSASLSTAPGSLASGKFHSVAHETHGTASILRLDDGSRILRLTEFTTSNGPDVRVYLVAANDATDDDTVKRAGFVELGKLKGTDGNQNYDVPADLDLTKYRAVTIWCKRFAVNFATAPLTLIS